MERIEEGSERAETRDRVQFSLRWLLAVTTATAVSCGLLATFGAGAVVVPLFGLALYLVLRAMVLRRFNLVVWGAAFLFAGLIFVAFAGRSVRWVGNRSVTFTFLVVDAENGRPVPGALVRIVDPEAANSLSQAQAGADGVANLSAEFRTAGTDSLLGRSGEVDLRRYQLEVAAADYVPLDAPLPRFTRARFDLFGPPLPSSRIELRRERPISQRESP